MGHTLTSQRMMVDLVIKELKDFAKVLPPKEKDLYLKMIKKPLRKVGAISYVSSINVWAFVIMSILLEQEKRILENELLGDGCIQEQEFDSLMVENK